MANPNQNDDFITLSMGLVSSLFTSIASSPLNIILSLICIGLVYFTYKSAIHDDKNKNSTPKKVLQPFPKGDMTLEELRKYDGTNDEGRVLLALNSEIYDVTKGSKFYGPDGPYANLAGRDATRALALFNVDAVKDTWDDHSDLSVQQMSTVTEWIEQFKEKYDFVGKLVKTEAEKSTPVEPADEESDDEDTSSVNKLK